MANVVELSIQNLRMPKSSIMLVIKRNFKNSFDVCLFFFLKSISRIKKKCFLNVEVKRDANDVFFFIFQMTTDSSPFEVPVFYPTYEEFQDFAKYVSSIEARGAHRVGLAKIVPPKEWKPRQAGYKHKQIDEKMIDNPIKQEVRGRDGTYSVFNIQQRSIKANSFQKLASSSRYAAPHSIGNDLEKLEKKYWTSLTGNAPIYGAGNYRINRRESE